MTRRRLGVLVVLAVLAGGLVFASVAPANRETVSGKVTITGSGTSWTLTFENATSSTGPIRCWRYTFPPGIQATGILAPPTGWQVGGSKPPPAPILGGRSDAGIPPGGRAAFPIQTDKPFDTAGPPGVAAISEDCRTDGAAPVTFGQEPPPEPAPCECKRLTVTASNYSSTQPGGGPTTMKLRLRWILACSKGDGACVGRLKLQQFAGTDIRIVSPRQPTVSCRGKCDAAGNTSAAGTVPLTVSSRETLDFDNRRGKTVVFAVRRFCVRGGKEIFVGTTRIRLAFNGAGFLDKKKSDLNGNGRPDGAEKA